MPLNARTAEQTKTTTGRKLTYRADIDGLRSLAVGSVILFHAGFSFIAGGYVGVDIFFVISGYLITSLLFAELDRTGRIDFVNFWARRTRRLMPSAILVIVVTMIVGWFVLSDLHMFYAGRDAIFASVYLTNWQKLVSAVSYFDDESGAGPFLHYWSLAVEEQFYLFLTLVFAIAVGLAGRRANFMTPAKIVIGLLFTAGIASFIVNLVSVADAQPVAFFGTHARIWQLALGAGIGVIERGGTLPGPTARRAAAWAGLAMMVASVLLLTDDLVYPGLYAVLPTLGAALFIFAGINAKSGADARDMIGHSGLVRAFGTMIPVSIGKISYALYLWHWPVFELYKASAESWKADDKVLAIAIVAALSVTSYLLLENPIRFSRRLALRPIGSLVTAACITLVVCSGAISIQSIKSESLIVLANGETLVPRAVQRDLPRIYREKCHTQLRDVDYIPCVFGQQDSDDKIFLIGDSHAAHWFPMVEAFALRHGYALYSRTKSACIGVDVIVRSSHLKREYVECAAWRKMVMDEIAREKPKIVVFGNSSAHLPFIPGQGHVKDEAGLRGLAEGEARTIEALLAQNIKVVLMKDMPWVPDDPIDCLVQHPKDGAKCRWDKDVSFLERRSPWSPDFYNWDENVKVVDLSYRSCHDDFCYAATDSLVRMRDSHHLTATYAVTLADDFEQQLFDFLDARHTDDDGSQDHFIHGAVDIPLGKD